MRSHRRTIRRGLPRARSRVNRGGGWSGPAGVLPVCVPLRGRPGVPVYFNLGLRVSRVAAE